MSVIGSSSSSSSLSTPVSSVRSNPPSFSSTSEAVVGLIFAHLKTRDLVRASGVCKRWNVLGHGLKLWTDLRSRTKNPASLFPREASVREEIMGLFPNATSAFSNILKHDPDFFSYTQCGRGPVEGESALSYTRKTAMLQAARCNDFALVLECLKMGADPQVNYKSKLDEYADDVELRSYFPCGRPNLSVMSMTLISFNRFLTSDAKESALEVMAHLIDRTTRKVMQQISAHWPNCPLPDSCQLITAQYHGTELFSGIDIEYAINSLSKPILDSDGKAMNDFDNRAILMALEHDSGVADMQLFEFHPHSFSSDRGNTVEKNAEAQGNYELLEEIERLQASRVNSSSSSSSSWY